MRRVYSLAIVPLLLVGAAAAPAQVYNQPYDRPYGDRDSARQDRALFDRARIDLDRAANYPWSNRDDRKRFDIARRELFDFQSKFDRGQYDKGQLNRTIDRLQDVLSHNSLEGRERATLDDDIRRMRDYRTFRNSRAGRDYDYSYRR
jgi:hypothetical protein